MNAFYLGQSLNALRPNSAFGCGETYDSIEWYSTNSETKPTEDEVNAKITELKNAEPMRLLREERNRRIATSDWRIVKAKETSTNIPAAWKTYRQALRDLPASSTPKLDSDDNLDMSSVTWPTPPS
tara:strand:- start:5 stop:382 length:378 start_codon:yes stop_codon:yes gene_type:complete